jgi:hypothetical protein
MFKRCTAKVGAVSVFFNLAADDNPFFDWLTSETDKGIDLSLIVTPDIALNTWIDGYVGGDTMPTCKPK